MKSPEKMHALIWEAPRSMSLREVALPELATEDVLVRVNRVGICGSELSGYLGHNALRVPPLVMGHEFSGEIAAMGSQVSTINSNLRLKQRVTANPMVFCRQCEYCLAGDTHLCLNRRLIGAHRPGAYAGYVAVPAWMVVPLDENLTDQDGAMVEPVACAVRIGRWVGDCAGKTVLITGAGTIGLLTLQVLIHNSAQRVYISDTDPERRQAARALGGEALDPIQDDIVKIARGCFTAVDAVGKALTREQCIRSVRSGSKVILSGLHEETSLVPVADVIRREITLCGSFCYTMNDFFQAMQLLSDRHVKLAPWVVEAPLSQGGYWFEQLCSEHPGGTAKVLLVP